MYDSPLIVYENNKMISRDFFVFYNIFIYFHESVRLILALLGVYSCNLIHKATTIHCPLVLYLLPPKYFLVAFFFIYYLNIYINVSVMLNLVYNSQFELFL